MAENKKKKTNWRDNLAAKAAQMNETVTVYINGEPETLVRGEQTDEQWDNIKKRAAADAAKQPDRWSGNDNILVYLPNSKGKVSIKRQDQTDEEWSRVVADVQKQYGKERVQYLTEDPSERKSEDGQWGPGTIFPTRADYLRLQKMPEGPEKKAELQRLTEEYRAQKADSSMQQEYQNAQKATDAAKQRVQQQKAATNKQEWNEEQASADPGMSVRGQMMKMATGATPGAQLKSGVVDNYSGAADEAGQIASAVGNEASKVGSELAAAPAKVGEGLAQAGSELAAVPGKVTDSPVGDFVKNVGQTASDMANDAFGIGTPSKAGPRTKILFNTPNVGVFTDQGGPNDLSGIEAQARRDPGVEYDPAIDPVSQPPVQPPVAPGSQSASVSASVVPQVSAPQVGFRPTDTTEFRNAVNAAKQNYDHVSKTLQETVDKQDEIALANEAKRNEYQRYADEQTQAAARLKMESVAKAERYQAARQNVLERARQAASDPIDPNRYWNDKNAGQKAAALIAGALFGFTGQGMNWLQRIDALVENDNKLQAADRASKVQGLQMEAQGLGELGQDALRNGASLAEAKLLEKQGKYEGLQVYLQGMAEKSKNLELRATYANMAADLATRSVGLEHQVALLHQADEARRSQIETHNADRRLEALKANATLGIKTAAGAKGEPLPAALTKRLDETFRAYQSVAKMEELARNTGLGSRALRAAKETVPGAVLTGGEDRASNDLYEQNKVELMKMRAGSALQKHEIDILDPIMGGSRSGLVDAHPTVKKVRDQYREQLINTLRGEAAAGRDVSQYLSILQSIDSPQGGTTGGITFTPSKK